MTQPHPARLLRQLIVVAPSPGAHRVALRAGLSVLVPLLVLWATDHLEWSIYATFGAFTSLYGRDRIGEARALLQVRVGTYLSAAVTLGTLVACAPERAWIAVPATAIVAALASFASDAERWHPPGPLFQVFAFAACASVPSEPSDIAIALLVAAAAAAFAVLVGNAGALWRSRHEPEPAPRPARTRAAYLASLRWHVLPSSLGVVVSGTIATAAGIGHPYWAMVSAVVPLVAVDFHAQLARGLHRVVGTGLGLLVAAVVLGLDLPALPLILMVVVLQVLAELTIGRNYALALVFVTPLALLMVNLAVPVPAASLIADRAIETLIGVGVGVAVGYVTRVRYPRS